MNAKRSLHACVHVHVYLLNGRQRGGTEPKEDDFSLRAKCISSSAHWTRIKDGRCIRTKVKVRGTRRQIRRKYGGEEKKRSFLASSKKGKGLKVPFFLEIVLRAVSFLSLSLSTFSWLSMGVFISREGKGKKESVKREKEPPHFLTSSQNGRTKKKEPLSPPLHICQGQSFPSSCGVVIISSRDKKKCFEPLSLFLPRLLYPFFFSPPEWREERSFLLRPPLSPPPGEIPPPPSPHPPKSAKRAVTSKKGALNTQWGSVAFLPYQGLSLFSTLPTTSLRTVG